MQLGHYMFKFSLEKHDISRFIYLTHFFFLVRSLISLDMTDATDALYKNHRIIVPLSYSLADAFFFCERNKKQYEVSISFVIPLAV